MSKDLNNPLHHIFIKTPEGGLTDELDNVTNIHFFFNFLKNDKITNDTKIHVLNDLTSKIRTNRYISEFFSKFDNKSIYIYLFDLYVKSESEKVKEAITNFMSELLINIETGKDIYEYLFQNLAKIYRGEIEHTSKNVQIYLKLLQIILSEIELKTPKTYFACSGHCQFSIDLNKIIFEVGHSFSVNLNFKISQYHADVKNPEKNRVANLVKFYFSNKKSLSIDLQYPFQLVVKEIRNEYIKTLPIDEWINLLVTIVLVKNNLQFYVFVNGENVSSPFKIEKITLRPDSTIKYINFFNNFYGEVSSICMFSQTELGHPGMNNSTFLSQLKNFREGFWKKKKFDAFMKVLQSYDSINREIHASKTVYAKNISDKNFEKRKTLYTNIVFLFSPMNTLSKKSNIVEDTFGKYQLQYSGNIRIHKYQSYQKKLALVGGFSNFYPIAEMFLIYPETLNEQNLETFLMTINSTLNYSKNLKLVNKSKLFKILSMFMEKYPNKVYNENILNALFSLGKTLFMNNLESECSNYFNYILLNEKILSKFNENLQSNFWKQLYLFCYSDVTQVEIFLNINRLCLILRYYDRNKYKEMCCQKHLDMIKEQYVGSRKVMNPTINTKLSQLNDIMSLIIDSSQSNSALAFFKLLTLDLSPCLIIFILNIFIKAFDKQKINDKWKMSFIEQLIQNKYEVILFNTFIHALPDVRIEILKFLFQIHKKLVEFKKLDNIKVLEKMLKTCLLPDKMFYNKKIFLKTEIKHDNIKEIKIENESKKPEEKKIEEKKEEIEEKQENIINEIKDEDKPITEENKKESDIEIKKEENEEKLKIDEIVKNKNEEGDKINDEIKEKIIGIKTEEKKEEIKIETNKEEQAKKDINQEKFRNLLNFLNSDDVEENENQTHENTNNETEKISTNKTETKEEQNIEDNSKENKIEEKKIEKEMKEENKIEDKDKDKEEETKKEKITKEEDNKKLEEPIKDEKIKEEKKDDIPKKEEIKEENEAKEEKKEGNIKKEEHKVDNTKKEEEKKTSNKKEEIKRAPPLKKDNDKQSEIKQAKTFQVKDNKNQDKSNPVSTKRKNFLALLSKFDPNADKPKVEEKKPVPKLIKKDNPFFQKLNSQKIPSEEERQKKEEEKRKKEKLEKERLEKEKLEKERIEKERIEKERLEKERQEKERLEKERIEKERLEKERIEKERQEKERIEKERIEKERIEKERIEKERQEKERLEKERIEKEKLEKERIEKERLEKEKLEKERLEKERLEKERLAKEKLEKEKKEKERLEKEKLEQEKLIKEKEQKEKEKEKERIESLEPKNNDNSNSEEEIIIKDSIYNDYIERLYSIFIFWTLSIDVSILFDAVTIKSCQIKNTNGIEILFLLHQKLNNMKYLLRFLNSINNIINMPSNSFRIFQNIKVYASFVDMAFKYKNLEGKDEKTCFDLCKNIIITSFTNSFEFCEKTKSKYPSKYVEILLIWGDKMIQEDETKKSEVTSFIFDLLMEFMTQYKIKYEPMLTLNSQKSYEIDNNYFMKNYLYFMSTIFHFIFRFQFDDYIIAKGVSSLFNFSKSITIQEEIINKMRMNDVKSCKIGEIWIDFPLINDIMSKIKNIWSKKNCYKGLKLEGFKSNKNKKYDYIIENIITNKEKKNSYQKELEFLCYEEKTDKFENIIPLIKLVPLTLICILTKLKDMDDDKDFRYWLKELKYFLRFIIIASANLIKIDQLDLYNSIQEKTLGPIAAIFCFIHSLFDSKCKCKIKIEKDLTSLLLLSFKIYKFQYNYKLKHKKIFMFSSKPTRNNLQDSAICKLFDLHVKDTQGNPYMNINLLDGITSAKESYEAKIYALLNSNDFIGAFFENKNLQNFLNDNFYSLIPYKNKVENRFNLIRNLQDDLDYSYKNTILLLLPQYENELAKYSNNSLEKTIKNKNRYKIFKKNAFSWRGFWSNRENFFKNISSFKLKLINHYTKNFMKPILKPIIDISYYLPEFSGFNPKDLFLPENDNKIFKLNMDLDKVLKITEQNISSNTKEKDETNENYLVNIYKKSNQTLYEKLLKISNNLEFGKEEEFSYVERDTSKESKKYFLSCLVKTSHHIKGVVFIDAKKLNFKVFLDQRTGNAMSGVEKGFTTQDDDYDQERKTCFGSYFVCHPKDKDLYKIGINYTDIKWIFKRKYYYNNSALEIFTTTNKTFYFNFKYENDRTSVLKEILKKLDEPLPIIDDLKDSKNQNIIGYENGTISKNKGLKIKSFNLSKLVKSWKNWEISNFDFLMWLNILGNRSYNDMSQYPIFPWTLINYEDPLQVEQEINLEKDKERENLRTMSVALPEIQNQLYLDEFGGSAKLNKKGHEENKIIIDYLYRNMKLPMGMLEISDESIKRKEEFDLNYETLLEMADENNKPYIYGSNYSNPIYVCNFLMRLFPFTHISIELQGQGFDKPDRLFLSVKNAFFNSTSQKGDVRELIPEFFYLPEMFKNINNLNMGKLETGEQVGDVLTPCNNNPYDFIMTMRSCLENNKISSDIQNWIDLIFGYKSRGKEAEKAKNIFKESSYQELIDINNIENKESKLREVEFGLIPNQLMIKECAKKEKKEVMRKGKEITDEECDLKCYDITYKNENDKFKPIEGYSVTKLACYSQDKLLILLGGSAFIERKVIYSIINKSYTEEFTNVNIINKFVNRIGEYYNPKKSDSKIMQFCHKGKTVIFGGFYDGKILIKSTSQEQKDNYLTEIPFMDKSPVISVAVDKEDEFAFFGNEMGNIRIMKLNKEIKESKLDLLITDHLSAISDINCSSDLNLWISASIDGYINLYTLPLSKLIRSIKVDTPYCDYVFLCASPLPSIVVIGEENKISEIFVYSINGELYLRQKEQDVIQCPIIIKDLNSNEYLAYIINESIIIRSIPTLIRQSSIEEIQDVWAIYPSEDMRKLYAINKSGTNIRIIKSDN